MIEFREEGHQYTDGGEIIPSVTQILATPGAYFTPGSAERGIRAHEACAAFARDGSALPDDPYAHAFAMWCWTRKPRWVELEAILEGRIDGRRYAGRLDGLAEIEGKTVLIDWKTGVRTERHHAQVAAYALVKKPARCLVLYLSRDGDFTEDWMTSSDLVRGLGIFRDAIRIYYGENQNDKTRVPAV